MKTAPGWTYNLVDKKEIDRANQAMYDHLDIYGWTRPAIEFLKHSTDKEHSSNGDKSTKQ